MWWTSRLAIPSLPGVPIGISGKAVGIQRSATSACFSYALAKDDDARLLWKGDDFGHTDLRRAV